MPECVLMCWYDGNREPEIVDGDEEDVIAMMDRWGPVSKRLYKDYIFFFADVTYSTDGI